MVRSFPPSLSRARRIREASRLQKLFRPPYIQTAMAVGAVPLLVSPMAALSETRKEGTRGQELGKFAFASAVRVCEGTKDSQVDGAATGNFEGDLLNTLELEGAVCCHVRLGGLR